MRESDATPVVGICGWSGSGKTTLIEKLAGTLVESGLKVIVAKHDCHGLDIDREGKDSDRLYKTGSDVLLQSDEETVLRSHGVERSFEDVIRALAPQYDLILIEGRKHTRFKKIWLLSDGEAEPPPGISNVFAVLSRDCDRYSLAMEALGKIGAVKLDHPRNERRAVEAR